MSICHRDSIRRAKFLFPQTSLSQAEASAEEVPPRLAASVDVKVDRLGPSRLVFGTQMPLKYPDPVLLKREVLDAPERVKEKIWGENAEKLLGG